MPAHFRLDFQDAAGRWIDWGTYARRSFERLEDGSYVCAGHGSPVWIRCVEQHGDRIIHVNGSGERHRYRLVPLDGEGAAL